jgi:hypothetical protein
MQQQEQSAGAQHQPVMGWGRFAAMIAVSVLFMFPLMYQLIYSLDHAMFSINRFVAALVMGCMMTLIMLGFMWPMYKGMGTKVAVLAGALVLGTVLLTVNRDQTLVGDTNFMKSMIPHHSIAINNARKADIRDPRVKALADDIIESQTREIAEMKWLLADIDRNGRLGDRTLPRAAAVLTPDLKRKGEEKIRSATPTSAQGRQPQL